MNLLSIYPAKDGGFALFSKRGLIACGSFPSDDLALESLLDAAFVNECRILVDSWGDEFIRFRTIAARESIPYDTVVTHDWLPHLGPHGFDFNFRREAAEHLVGFVFDEPVDAILMGVILG